PDLRRLGLHAPAPPLPGAVGEGTGARGQARRRAPVDRPWPALRQALPPRPPGGVRREGPPRVGGGGRRRQRVGELPRRAGGRRAVRSAGADRDLPVRPDRREESSLPAGVDPGRLRGQARRESVTLMRIAYLLESTELSGGVKVVLQQAEALARRGHRVTVVSPGPSPPWFSLAQARFERTSFRESRALAEADVRVATFWTTVAPALEAALGPVFHLCQGYEGAFSFYADRRGEIEDAYRAPTRKLAVSSSLAARLETLGFGPAQDIGQTFDSSGFFPVSEGGEDPNATPILLVVGVYEADVKGIGVALEGLRRCRERGGVFRLRRVSTHAAGDEEKSAGVVDEYHHALAPDRMPFAYRASDLF